MVELIRSRFCWQALVSCCVMIAGTCNAAQDDPFKKLHNEFQNEIAPILKSKCNACHSGDDANAGVNFDSYQNLEHVLNADRRWLQIKNEIVSENMPPDDEPQLSKRESAKLTNWIENVFNLLNCDSVNPGNVTIRKLTRYQYRNSVRDLFDVDYRLADSFPGDDVGHGFDNIADVLSLPPILMEKYLDAAEQITKQAIFDPDNLPLDIELAAEGFQLEAFNGRKSNGEVRFYSQGKINKFIRFPERGAYALAIFAYGDQAGDEDVKMSLHIDNELIETVDVKSTRRKPSRHVFRVPIFEPGKKKVSISFDNDYFQARVVGRQDRNLYVENIVIKGPKRKAPSLPYLKFTSPDRNSAKNYIDEILPRAFRSPVDDKQKQRFLNLYDQCQNEGLSFYESLQRVTQAILISPQFLYRFEQPVKPGSQRSLDDFERATALSYFIWNSTPDDELLKLASQSKLSQPKIWNQQTRRLLSDSRTHSLIDNFVAQWLNLKLLASAQPDFSVFPSVDRKLLQAMETETRMVVSDIFKRDASILELLDCDFTYLNERLAQHYELPNISGNQFRKVSTAGKRSGVLTHASILTLTSNPTRTSPVKRGKWVMENILGEDPPPAVDTIVPLDDQKELTGTLRQRMQQHRSDPACASCHRKMDAIGFALENYDAVGRFRMEDEGFKIDATSEMPDGTVLAGANGLQDKLRTTYKNEFVRCFAEKLLVYALGRGLQYYDRCTVKRIVKYASENDYRVSSFVVAIAQSETFLKRSGKKPQLPGASK